MVTIYKYYIRRYISLISVGIDVSKDKSTVCILKPYGEIVQRSFEIKFK